eukprot:evm.model.NODE_34648_length_3938_cov_17.449467.3
MAQDKGSVPAQPPLSQSPSYPPAAPSPFPERLRMPPELETEVAPPPLLFQPPRLLRILFVDTYVARASEIRRVLEHESRGGLFPELVAAFDVVRDGLEALALAQVVPYDAVILSAGLRDITADELVGAILNIGLRVPLILMAAPHTVDTQKAAARGFNAILLRPVTGTGLAGVIRALCLSPLPSLSPQSQTQGPASQAEARASPSSPSSSSLQAATTRKRPDLPPPQDLPDWDDVIAGIATIYEDDDIQTSSMSAWRPPQILRMPISQTLSHLRLQAHEPKRVAPVPRGWCVKKKSKKI